MARGGRSGPSLTRTNHWRRCCALESSAEGCRRLLDEWTGILDWLGQLGPEGIASSGIHTRLDNLMGALGLLGVRVTDPDDVALATADPLAAPFLRAWQAVKDQAFREFMEYNLDEDDDPPPPEGPELVAPELIASWWAAVGTALGKLAAERCARLNTMLAGHQEGEVESRGRLAFEASFDDSAEGERLHRYQARWGRSLLRTLAALEELRGRGRLDHQEAEEVCVGQDSNPAHCMHRGDKIGILSHGRTGRGRATGGPRSGADPVEQTERGHDRVAADDPPIRRKKSGKTNPPMTSGRRGEKGQNKPTAVTRTLVKKVKMEPCVERPVASKATMAHSPCRESHQAGHGLRTQKCTSDGSDRTRMVACTSDSVRRSGRTSRSDKKRVRLSVRGFGIMPAESEAIVS